MTDSQWCPEFKQKQVERTHEGWCRWRRVSPQKSHRRLELKRIYSYLFTESYTNGLPLSTLSPTIYDRWSMSLHSFAVTSFRHSLLTNNWLPEDRPPTFPHFVFVLSCFALFLSKRQQSSNQSHGSRASLLTELWSCLRDVQRIHISRGLLLSDSAA